MTEFLRRFYQDTSGAVTVDWVVLTAAVVGMGIMAAVEVATGAADMGSNIGTYLTTDETFIQNQ